MLRKVTMHMNIVLKVCIFVILYIIYMFAGAAVVYVIGEYYEDDRKRRPVFNNVIAIILWPLAAFVFFVIETFEYVRQKLNNKKE